MDMNMLHVLIVHVYTHPPCQANLYVNIGVGDGPAGPAVAGPIIWAVIDHTPTPSC